MLAMSALSFAARHSIPRLSTPNGHLKFLFSDQYNADCIPDLIAPILSGEADIVVGERPILNHQEFSWVKKILQKLGSFVVRFLSGTDIKDAPSGFRAISRDAALQLDVHSGYTYTLETLIQAGQRNLKVVSVPIEVNPYLRPSRLLSSIPSYIQKSLSTMIRYFVIYNSFKFFMLMASMMFLGGFSIGARFLYFYLSGEGSGKIQSLILGSSLGVVSVLVFMFGFISDMIATNRKILENLQYLKRKQTFDNTTAENSSHQENKVA
jgi:hypothetical protein